MNSSARPPLMDVTPVANVPTPTGTDPLIAPPTTPGTSCATCVARRSSTRRSSDAGPSEQIERRRSTTPATQVAQLVPGVVAAR